MPKPISYIWIPSRISTMPVIVSFVDPIAYSIFTIPADPWKSKVELLRTKKDSTLPELL